MRRHLSLLSIALISAMGYSLSYAMPQAPRAKPVPYNPAADVRRDWRICEIPDTYRRRRRQRHRMQ
jgi:hypothetical protein